MTEGWDWARVQTEPCPRCGWDPRPLRGTSLHGEYLAVTAAWQHLLTTAALGALRRRPSPSEWSPLELGCHVRDVLWIFDGRILRAVTEDEPELGWWDHEAAVVDDAYLDQDPTAVADDLVVAGAALGLAHDDLTPDQRARRATRRTGEHFTVEGMALFALHEAVHHLRDARRALDRVPSDP